MAIQSQRKKIFSGTGLAPWAIGIFFVGFFTLMIPTVTAQTPNDFCGDEQGMANYFGVPYPARSSTAATSLITCILLFIPDSELIDDKKIFTFQRNNDLRLLNYTRGNRVCGITDTTCLAYGGCHTVNSCHYGGRTGTDGAEGVDFNARDPSRESELFEALKTLVSPNGKCHGLAKYIGLEGDHTHLSTNTDAGCDTTNIEGITPAGAGPVTTVTRPITTPRASSLLPNPINCKTVTCVLVGIVKIVLAVLGIFGTFMFVYGGFMFLTSGGNADMVRKGKSTLLYSTLGMVLVLASWIVVSTVFRVTSSGTL